MKIILHKTKEVTTEYYNETLKEVLAKVGTEGKLYLEKWNDDYTIFSSSYIGDLRFGISQEDYYRAYDECLNGGKEI